MADIIQFPGDRLYNAKRFPVTIEGAEWSCSGMIEGLIELHTPDRSWPLTPDEAHALVIALSNSRIDVLENSRPNCDPRIIR